jgi:4-azaleucine resistance transporter AzlC
MVFGVLAAESGLDIFTAVAFSMAVIAGAAQFTALSLMQDQAPVFIVIIVGLAVNLRMALYSATLATHLGAAPFWTRAFVAYAILDHSFALADQKYQNEPDMSLPRKLAFYFGATSLVAVIWVVGTGFGAWLGTRIPDWLALDFAMPIAFIALVAPALRSLPHVVAAFTAATLSLLLAPAPYGLGLIIAALIALVLALRWSDAWGRDHEHFDRNTLACDCRAGLWFLAPALFVFGYHRQQRAARMGQTPSSLYACGCHAGHYRTPGFHAARDRWGL